MTENTPRLVITRGLPGSGKTTWAKSIGVTRVNRDELRLMLYPEYRGKPNWTRERHVTEAQRALVIALLKAGQSVIVDDTNLRAKQARNWLDLAVSLGVPWEVKNFDTPVEECIRRDSLREHPVGEAVIRDMYAKFFQGKDYLPMVSVPSSDENQVQETKEAYLAPEGATTALIVDLDGTLALIGDRSPYDWSRVGEDEMNWPIFYVMTALRDAMTAEVIFVSGRSEECRPQTEQWLSDKLALGYPYIDKETFPPLFMRPAGDNRKDAIIKREIFDQHIRNKYDVKYVIDDRNQVVAMWRSLGLTVLQVADGDF
ncbi:MAG: 5'-hydroxyl kinase [Acidimicrobiales bacterium]|nr:MAG: 5'-hydroxyl kinase [Acidimicrobiales bacterium]